MSMECGGGVKVHRIFWMVLTQLGKKGVLVILIESGVKER